jgi:hypothetical protein
MVAFDAHPFAHASPGISNAPTRIYELSKGNVSGIGDEESTEPRQASTACSSIIGPKGE